MAENSRFLQVHPDAIIEWIWDDQFYYSDEYSIIKDIKNGETSFSFSANAIDQMNYNKLPNQLYTIDKVINRFGVVDINKPVFQTTNYVNNQPSKFNKVKIWFPIHYTFSNFTGFYLKTSALNYENKISYNLSNFFLDISNPGELSKIQNESKPFRLNEKLWGKSITIYVPSVYDEALKRVNNAPEVGSINYNLTNGVLGLSQTSSISIDFRFLSKKTTILGETTYLTTPRLVTSLPQAPEYNNLSVKIEEATDGDYFKINGLFNGNISQFESFMSALQQSGNRSYILYAITVYEENIPQDTREIYVYQDFFKGIDDFRPVFKFSNTTASIRVDMKLINSVDSNVIIKSAELTLSGNNISKYGKYITPINILGAIKPKIYNSLPDQLVLPSKELINSHLKKKNIKSQIRFVTYPILTNAYNIVAQDVSTEINNNKYFGFGELNLSLKPFDNVIKLSINETINGTIVPYTIQSSVSIVQLVFKSTITELRLPLYLETNENNLAGGVVVFKIPSTELEKLNKIYLKSNQFYITITSNGIETVIYNGLFNLVSDKIETPQFTSVVIPNLKSRDNLDRNLIKLENLSQINFSGKQIKRIL